MEARGAGAGRKRLRMETRDGKRPSSPGAVYAKEWRVANLKNLPEYEELPPELKAAGLESYIKGLRDRAEAKDEKKSPRSKESAVYSSPIHEWLASFHPVRKTAHLRSKIKEVEDSCGVSISIAGERGRISKRSEVRIGPNAKHAQDGAVGQARQLLLKLLKQESEQEVSRRELERRLLLAYREHYESGAGNPKR